MSILRRSLFAAVAATLCFGPVATAPLSAMPPKRLAQYAKLPDWSGLWGLKSSGKLSDPVIVPRKGKREYPPYNAEWEAKYVRNLQLAEDQGVPGKEQIVDTHTIYCVAGFPRDIANIFSRFYVVTPEITFILVGGEMRLIYTDGRKLPPEDEVWPKYQGWSLGHWEGQTLVIETRYAEPDLWAGQTPLLFSEKAVFTERITMVNPNTLENKITIVDPDSLTKTWSFTRQYLRQDFSEWADEKEICTGKGDRHPISADGKMSTDLPAAK